MKDRYGDFKSTALIDPDWYVYRVCRRIKKRTYRKSNLVIIYDSKSNGKASGKTMLLHDLCKAIPDSHYMTCMQLQLIVLEAIRDHGSLGDVVKGIGKADLLVIDDLECVHGMEATQEAIARICLMLSKNMKVVIACGMPVKLLSSFYKVLKAHGSFYQMKGPTLFTTLRIAFMTRKQYESYLSHCEVWDIVLHSNNDIRQVIGRITTESARRKLNT